MAIKKNQLPMARIRVIVSVIAALGSLILFAYYALGYFDPSVTASVGRGSTIIAIILSISAFVLCLKIPLSPPPGSTSPSSSPRSGSVKLLREILPVNCEGINDQEFE